jgi:hypothetical protein
VCLLISAQRYYLWGSQPRLTMCLCPPIRYLSPVARHQVDRTAGFKQKPESTLEHDRPHQNAIKQSHILQCTISPACYKLQAAQLLHSNPRTCGTRIPGGHVRNVVSSRHRVGHARQLWCKPKDSPRWRYGNEHAELRAQSTVRGYMRDFESVTVFQQSWQLQGDETSHTSCGKNTTK